MNYAWDRTRETRGRRVSSLLLRAAIAKGFVGHRGSLTLFGHPYAWGDFSRHHIDIPVAVDGKRAAAAVVEGLDDNG